MDLTQIFNYIPLLFQYGAKVKEILDIAMSNEDIVSKIRKEVPHLVPLLEEYGAKLFPQAAESIHLVGGAVAAFDTNVTKWIQGACNNIVGTRLIVDGIYGARTRDAVMKLQEKLGLKVDGLAGRLTQAALDQFFASQAKKG